MINFTTQKQYNLYCDYLIALCGIVKDALGISSDKSKGFPNKSFKDNLGNRAVLVSDPTDGDQYGILSGELYPPSLILHISDLLKAEGKDLPIWHSDYESLEHHTRQVCSKDFRFIHQIDALPKTADDRVIVEDPEIKLQPLPDAVKELIDEVIDGNVDDETPIAWKIKTIICHTCGEIELKGNSFCSDATLEQYVCSDCNEEIETTFLP